MPGGLLVLSSYGNQNIIVSGNPQVSYYKTVFRQYTHFSNESITVPLSTTSIITFNRGTTFRTNIPRNADMLSALYLTIRLPPIYSKAYVPTGMDQYLDAIPYEFQWIPNIGAHIIESAELLIGGQSISRIPGEWLFARRNLDIGEAAQAEKLSRLWGNTPELTDPANGIYSWVDVNGKGWYPTVFPTSDAIQNNRFSIPETFLRIPLTFWFGEDTTLALPLIALQKHDVEVAITLRPTQDLYTVVDVYSADSPRPRIRPRDQLDMRPSAFFLDAGMGNASVDYWDMRPELEGTYVFLTQAERRFVVDNAQNYVIRRVQERIFQGITSETRLDLNDQHGLASRIVWFARRPDAIAERNDYENYTNWIDPNVAPRQTGAGVPSTVPDSGVNLPTSQRDIIVSAYLLCNGEKILNNKPSGYYTDIQPYERCAGAGMTGLHMLSFELFHSATTPAGALNTSLFRTLQLDVSVNPPIDGFTHTIMVYIETINFLHIEGGMGGLVFAT